MGQTAKKVHILRTATREGFHIGVHTILEICEFALPEKALRLCYLLGVQDLTLLDRHLLISGIPSCGSLRRAHYCTASPPDAKLLHAPQWYPNAEDWECQVGRGVDFLRVGFRV